MKMDYRRMTRPAGAYGADIARVADPFPEAPRARAPWRDAAMEKVA